MNANAGASMVPIVVSIAALLEQLAAEGRKLARSVTNQLAEAGSSEPHDHGAAETAGMATPAPMMIANNTIEIAALPPKPKDKKLLVLVTPEEVAELL